MTFKISAKTIIQTAAIMGTGDIMAQYLEYDRKDEKMIKLLKGQSFVFSKHKLIQNKKQPELITKMIEAFVPPMLVLEQDSQECCLE